MISLVWKDASLDKCPWCNGVGSLEHCLFLCQCVDEMQHQIKRENSCLLTPWSQCIWCFGALQSELNPTVWVVNFTIYKGMLCALKGKNESLYVLVQSECSCYEYLFPILARLKWTDV